MAIHVEEEALNDLILIFCLIPSIKLTRLQNLINEITSGDIQGDPANDLLQKFQSKEETFKRLAQTIDDAEEYMGMQKTKFTSLIGDLSSSMK